MTALMQEIEEKAAMLSPEEKELLAERLLARLDAGSLNEIEEAWVEEAEKRYQNWKARRAEALAGDEVLADIRRELKL
ncbi:MAG: addiction module protein [Proteobacteria bacterium]|nr:addiction module protein [Pseudomonadota bacterium]